MSFLIATPELVSAASADLANLASTIGSANGAVAAATTGILPAALDEVSAGIAAMFGAHGQLYQALSAQAAQFHEQFVQAMAVSAGAYANAEANVVQTLSGGSTPAAAQAAANAPGSLLKQLETAQINFNQNLVAGELKFNQSLLTNEIGLEKAIFGTDSALNGVVNRSFNVGNLLWGTGQQTLKLFSGAQVPTTFTSGLLTGSAAQVFNSGAIGGPLGAFDQSLVVGADAAGLVLTSPPGQALLSVLPASTQASLLSAPGNFLKGIEAAQLNYNTNLITGELKFNQSLLTHEVGLEKAIFGTDSALNGTVNRAFNAGNLLWGTGQQALNGFSGALPGTGFNSSLLLGSGAQTFNGGQIGGPLGSFDQSLAFGADLAGLFLGT
jgi:hypothetical protein